MGNEASAAPMSEPPAWVNSPAPAEAVKVPAPTDLSAHPVVSVVKTPFVISSPPVAVMIQSESVLSSRNGPSLSSTSVKVQLVWLVRDSLRRA